MSRRPVMALLLGLVVTVTACTGGQTREVPSLPPSEPFPTATVVLRSPEGEAVDLPVYVAHDPEQRGFGLMEREQLPDGTGMVFLFPEDQSGAFYMYRTLIPLSIAFYGAGGDVVSTLDMDPCPDDDPAACERYDPGVPYRGAIEVNQGFFDEIGLREGWTVELPTNLPSPS